MAALVPQDTDPRIANLLADLHEEITAEEVRAGFVLQLSTRNRAILAFSVPVLIAFAVRAVRGLVPDVESLALAAGAAIATAAMLRPPWAPSRWIAEPGVVAIGSLLALVLGPLLGENGATPGVSTSSAVLGLAGRSVAAIFARRWLQPFAPRRRGPLHALLLPTAAAGFGLLLCAGWPAGVDRPQVVGLGLATYALVVLADFGSRLRRDGR